MIEPLFFNVGLVAALRSFVSGGKIVGVMITASHNPIQDNGVKLIAPNGEMLDNDWECIVEDLCNTHDTDQTIKCIEDVLSKYKTDPSSASETLSPAQVIVGLDTRPSSEALAALLKRGLAVWDEMVKYVDYGFVTTPALHYLVGESNKLGIKLCDGPLPLKNYYDKLLNGFIAVGELKCPKASVLIVDCANGVGFETMQYLVNDEALGRYLRIELINTGNGILNKQCGADHVKSLRQAPDNADRRECKYASLDGDADRLVYFYLDTSGELVLLDGDKIMALYAKFFKEYLVATGLDQQLSLGSVQTAYANGASTQYLEQVLGIHVDCVDTGVKNLHKQAKQYDIGLYFEANGHGTVWLSEKAISAIDGDAHELSIKLRAMLRLLNNYTGDAISDMLLVEAVLAHYDWTLTQWNELYEDWPNCLTKIQVKDKDVIKTKDAGRTCVEPTDAQTIINGIVKMHEPARCFIRPSGTENVVRIYAEAQTQQLADQLASKVAQSMSELLN